MIYVAVHAHLRIFFLLILPKEVKIRELMKEKSSESFFSSVTAKYAIHDETNTQPPKNIYNKKLSAMIRKSLKKKKMQFPGTIVFQVKAHILQ